MGEITVRGRKFPIAGDTPTDAEQRAIARFIASEAQRTPRPADQISAATAAAGDVGPDVVRNNRGQAIDAEGNVVGPPVTQTVDPEGVARFSSPEPYQPSGPLSGAQNRSATLEGNAARAEDVLTRQADALSFGWLPKISASNVGRYISRVGQTPISDLVRGNIIPDPNADKTNKEVLEKRRQEVKEAGERLGPAGEILADLSGGVLSGTALQRGGVTVLGHVPQKAGVIAKTAAGATEGGLYGAVSGAGHTDSDKLADYFTNAGWGGLLGAATGGVTTAVPAIGQKLVTPFPSRDPARESLVRTLKEADVDVTAGQKTGSHTLRTMEDTVGKLPFGRRPTEQQMEQVTAAAMKKSGLGGGSRATPEVLDEGFTRIGSDIGKINQSVRIRADDDLLNAAVKVEGDIPLVSEGYQKSVRTFIDKITGKEELTPDMAQSLREQLRKAIASQNGPGGDKLYQSTLIDLREALDDSLTRALRNAGKHDEIKELAKLRQQYANLHVLTDAIGRSGASGEHGIVTPAALSAAEKSSLGRTSYARGRGDLTDLAKASTGLLQGVPDSYTATREGMLNPLKIGAGIPLGWAVNTGPAQRYWGNQVTAPVTPSLLQPSVAGAAGAAGASGGTTGVPGPADRIMEGLLMP